jgi:hypothetical protein
MTSQTSTAANNKASAADSMAKLKGQVLPSGGNDYADDGGPTNQDYKADNDSAKITMTNSPGQTSTVANDKGGSTQTTGGGTSKKSLGKDLIPGDEDGTKGRSGPGPDKLSKGKVSYEHNEIDNEAGTQLDELSDSNNASDEFRERARIIFEAALNEKLQLEVTRLEEEFSTKFEEEITSIAEKVEAFLNYTTAQWLEENKLVVENGIRNQLAESFVSGLRSLFVDHYVTLPDEKYDIFESMVAKLDEMEEKLNEQIDANVGLNEQLSSFQRQSILTNVAWDLSEAGKERLAGLAESVEFESEDTYRKKLEILKESYVAASNEQPKGDYLSEETEVLQEEVQEEADDVMAQYARALSRTLR